MTDEQWSRVRATLYENLGTDADFRSYVDAMQWWKHHGGSWQDLARRYDTGKSLRRLFYYWRAIGVWAQVERALAGLPTSKVTDFTVRVSRARKPKKQRRPKKPKRPRTPRIPNFCAQARNGSMPEHVWDRIVSVLVSRGHTDHLNTPGIRSWVSVALYRHSFGLKSPLPSTFAWDQLLHYLDVWERSGAWDEILEARKVCPTCKDVNCRSEICGEITKDDLRRIHLAQIWDEAKRKPSYSRMAWVRHAYDRGDFEW